MDAEQASPSLEDRIGDKMWGPAEQPEPQQAVQADDDQSDDAADDQAEGDEDDAPAQSNAVEEVEIEVEGWKGKIPAKVKAELDKASDYTRKTQEVAEQRRVLDAQYRLRQEEQQFYQSAKPEIEQLQQIDAQLEQYRRVDLSQIDSETLSRMSMSAANLREERVKLKEALDGKQGQFKASIHAAWDQMGESARKAILLKAPDWDASAKSLGKYAIDEGYAYELVTGRDPKTNERVSPGIVDPVFANTLLKAWKWDQLQAKKPAATEKANKAAPLVKPGAVNTQGQKQVAHMNFRKAMKNASSEGQKAELIRQRLENKLYR